MLDIAIGYDEQVRDWVSKELGLEKIGGDMFAAIGIAEDGELISGALFHDYREYMVEMSFASTSPTWCSRKTLKALFDYPFNQLGVTRINANCAKGNKKMRDIVRRIGFKQEGCARKGYDGKQDAVLYGMLNKECKWN